MNKNFVVQKLQFTKRQCMEIFEYGRIETEGWFKPTKSWLCAPNGSIMRYKWDSCLLLACSGSQCQLPL